MLAIAMSFGLKMAKFDSRFGNVLRCRLRFKNSLQLSMIASGGAFRMALQGSASAQLGFGVAGWVAREDGDPEQVTL